MRRSIGLLSLPSLSRIKTVISILACSPNLTHWRWVIVPEKSPAAEMASSGIVSVAALSVPLGLNCDCQCIVTGGVTSPLGSENSTDQVNWLLSGKPVGGHSSRFNSESTYEKFERRGGWLPISVGPEQDESRTDPSSNPGSLPTALNSPKPLYRTTSRLGRPCVVAILQPVIRASFVRTVGRPRVGTPAQAEANREMCSLQDRDGRRNHVGVVGGAPNVYSTPVAPSGGDRL